MSHSILPYTISSSRSITQPCSFCFYRSGGTSPVESQHSEPNPEQSHLVELPAQQYKGKCKSMLLGRYFMQHCWKCQKDNLTSSGIQARLNWRKEVLELKVRRRIEKDAGHSDLPELSLFCVNFKD
ncbi:uncharacterized protein LOC121050290 [Rosa chinensis]|uniref:uncharacterized protein LOC121050290 n=1 Tax=Rosa chinensis TaxID=74649 RepID=UPI001AD8FCD5|nr:uncharacterized protein LOC121050290 [Rosa chinensis]